MRQACAILILLLSSAPILGSEPTPAQGKDAGPRKLPILEVETEDGLGGIVEATKGRIVVLKGGKSFLVNDDTIYGRETGFDLAFATAAILAPGTSVMAAGKTGPDGQMLARLVYVVRFHVPRAAASGPDLMEWSTSGVAEGLEDDRILLDEHRYIPIDEHTKFFVNAGGKVLPADRKAVTKGARLGFTISGRSAVLRGKEAGTVTISAVTVHKPADP